MGCVKYFPQARTLVSAQEFIAVMREYSLNQLDGTFHVKTDVDNALRAETQWQLVYEDCLPLAEELPFRLCHIAEQLEHNIRD